MSEQIDRETIGVIDDSAIIPPGWVWTPEESAGIELDEDALAELFGRLLAEDAQAEPSPEPKAAWSVEGMVKAVVKTITERVQG